MTSSSELGEASYGNLDFVSRVLATREMAVRFRQFSLPHMVGALRCSDKL